MKAFRDLIINIGGASTCKQGNPWLLSEGQDEPIPKKEIMSYTLTKPIKPGFRRLLTIVPDEALDKLASGEYATAEVLQGDSSFTIAPAVAIKPGDPVSTEKSVKAYAYGDGALGDKVARVHVDGHIGEGIADVTLDIMWTVAHPDATVLGVTEGPDEAIPVP